MTSTRSYRKALDDSDVWERFVANRGTQFDSQVLDAFLRLKRKDTQPETRPTARAATVCAAYARIAHSNYPVAGEVTLAQDV